MIGKDAVVEYFGYWPEFCDSKVLGFHFDFEKNEILLSVEYLDADQSLNSKIDFSCSGVYELLISELREGAVIESLAFQEEEGKVLIQLNGVYGISGEFYCRSVSLHMVKKGT